MKQVIIITDNTINNQLGGLERAAKTFREWFLEESYKVLNINKKNYIKKFNKLLKADLILFVGHRSYFLLLIAALICFFNKEFVWCAFWHDYKLEKKNNLIFYKLYDYFFKIFYHQAIINLVVSDYESQKISSKSKSKKIFLPTFVSCKTNKLESNRPNDVFIPGRDVPHKRFKLIRNICSELGLKYLETNSNLLSETEIINAYLSTKYIFVPSLYESYSLVALEGMSCGCNVIVSDAVMIKDNLNKYNNFQILDKNDWNSENVKNLLNKFPNNIENSKNALKIQDEFSNNLCKRIFLKQFYS